MEEQKTAFDLSQELATINAGADRYDMSQLYPISGNVTGAIVGAGSAAGMTTFQWQDSANWWSPVNSYFVLDLTFIENATVPSPAKPVAYADNFAMTLFTQINSQINSRPLDTVNTPWIIDTALTYSKAHNNFLKTWGSLTRLGEPLTTRLINTQGNGGRIEVVFRPPVSLFDVKMLPPGAQFRIDFNWASNGLNAFESINRSLNWSATASDYNVSITVNSFSFYKATLHPGPNVALPEKGVIELCPCTANQYYLNGGSQLRQNITLPSTANRILVVFQDINTNTVTTVPPVDFICGVGSGYNPATSFTNKFTTSASNNITFAAATTGLATMWLDLPELGIQEPKPIYNFGSTSTSIVDYMRAYSDFCHITQGTLDNTEGSIPFGSMSVATGTSILWIDRDLTLTGSPVDAGTLDAGTYQIGDPNNPQQYPYVLFNATAPSALTYNQTARWGWLGRCPGPIFAFPVVRPEGKTVSTGTLNVTTQAGVISMAATVLASYSMAIVLELQPSGYYQYTLIEGV